MKTRLLFAILVACAGVELAQSEQVIIPVSAWPRVLNLADKQIINPDVKQCVKAGYRLLGEEPATPAGKQVKTRVVIQDPDKPEMAKIVVTYEDIPIVIPPTPPLPEVLTNIPSARVSFRFTTNGQYRGVSWIDAPGTNQ